MVFFKHRGIFMVSFHVSGGILVILCALPGGGGGWSFFLKKSFESVSVII